MGWRREAERDWDGEITLVLAVVAGCVRFTEELTLLYGLGAPSAHTTSDLMVSMGVWMHEAGLVHGPHFRCGPQVGSVLRVTKDVVWPRLQKTAMLPRARVDG